MKKIFVLGAAALAMTLSSCTSISNTATTTDVNSSIWNRTTADLEVSTERVSYTLTPSKEQQRAGIGSCKNAAVAGALDASGADVLVNPRFEVKSKKRIAKQVKVTGRPAKFKNFHPTTLEEVGIITSLKGKK